MGDGIYMHTRYIILHVLVWYTYSVVMVMLLFTYFANCIIPTFIKIDLKKPVTALLLLFF